MSPNRVPPSFPQPFDSTSTTNPPPYTTSTPEQRSIVPGQGSAYSPGIHAPRGTQNAGPPPIPPQPLYPSGHVPASQPIHGPVQTRPAFPMPQVPHPAPHPHVPTTSGPPPPPPPPPIVQWSDPTRMPSHPPSHNTPVAPGSHSGPHLQAPLMMSHSLSQHDGMSGAAHIYPRVPRTQVDSNNEGHVVGQSFPETPHHDRRAKGPPNPVAAGVRKCRRCNRPCPPGYAYCSASCQSAR